MCLSVSPQFACLCQPRCHFLSCIALSATKMDRNATLLCWLCFEQQSHILHLYFSFFLLCSCLVRHRVRYLSLESRRSMFDPCRCQLMPLYNMLSLNSIGFILAAFTVRDTEYQQVHISPNRNAIFQQCSMWHTCYRRTQTWHIPDER